jgi:hypothetical protein
VLVTPVNLIFSGSCYKSGTVVFINIISTVEGTTCTVFGGWAEQTFLPVSPEKVLIPYPSTEWAEQCSVNYEIVSSPIDFIHISMAAQSLVWKSL